MNAQSNLFLSDLAISEEDDFVSDEKRDKVHQILCRDVSTHLVL